MDEQELDLDNLDKLLEDFDGVIVEAASIQKMTTAAKAARAKNQLRPSEYQQTNHLHH